MPPSSCRPPRNPRRSTPTTGHARNQVGTTTAAAVAPGGGALLGGRSQGRRAKAAREQAPESRRQLRPLEKKSFQTLNLSGEATKVEIKARFKELVKIYHPDTNGGDARSGDKLREIIQAYNYLKQAGLV